MEWHCQVILPRLFTTIPNTDHAPDGSYVYHKYSLQLHRRFCRGTSQSGQYCRSVTSCIDMYHTIDLYAVAFGTIVTGSASLLFALINTSSTYWAFGFPAAVMSVFGADFVFAAGTIFVAKVALPHEQSLAGALFQTMTQVSCIPWTFDVIYAEQDQIGTSFGLTTTTSVFDKIVARDSQRLGLSVTYSDMMVPRSAQLSGYRGAQWTSLAFALFCESVIWLLGEILSDIS